MKRIVVVVAALAACKGAVKHRNQAAPDLTGLTADQVAGSGMTAEPRLGPPNPGGDRELAFAITKVYTAQKPVAEAPFHAPGGDLTYFDARLSADPAATFTIGMPKLAAGADGFGGFAKVWLVPTNVEAGTHFVAAFAKEFHVVVPPPAKGTLAPLHVPIAVLGVGMNASESGYAGQGTWDATKLFLSAGDIDSAELFFNVSVDGKRGVFSEKDESYDQDDLKVLAIALRDGVPPPRTPENDPTLAARPVTLALGKPVASRHVTVIGHSAKRVLLTEMLDDHASVIAVDLATGTPKELYRTPDRLFEGLCDDAAEHCLLSESRGKDRHSFSGADPATLLALDGDKVTRLAVPGTGKSPSAKAISPGGRFVIANGERAAVVILDRKTGKATPPDTSDGYREILTWRGEATAIVSIEDFKKPDAPKQYAAWHLDTGKLEPLDGPPPVPAISSPDGSRTARIAGGKVTVTPTTGAARTLVLDARDAGAAPDCCAWLDSRYLSFPGKTFGVFDTDAMKIAFVAGVPEDDDQRVTALPGSMQALVTRGEATYLAKIVP